MMNEELRKKPAEIRTTVVETIAKAKRGNLEGVLNYTDLLVHIYYNSVLKNDYY